MLLTGPHMRPISINSEEKIKLLDNLQNFTSNGEIHAYENAAQKRTETWPRNGRFYWRMPYFFKRQEIKVLTNFQKC